MRFSRARRFLDAVASPRLTVGCLVAAMVLVFAGTLAQVFAPDLPVRPAGYVVAVVLLANVVAAQFVRFGPGWNGIGLRLLHGGIGILIAGGLLADFAAVESRMRIGPGETRDFCEDARRWEWVDAGEDAEGIGHVTVIAGAHVRPLRHRMPYRITLRELIREYYPETGVPMRIASLVTLEDPARGVRRDAEISMNHPLRYAGDTICHAGFGEDGRSAVLLVARNPGFAAPYFAVMCMGAGVCIQAMARRGGGARAR